MTMVKQAVPLQHREDHGEADIHLQPVKDSKTSGCPKESVGSPHWSRVLAESVDLRKERSTRWSRFAGRACDPTGNSHWSSLFLKDCTP